MMAFDIRSIKASIKRIEGYQSLRALKDDIVEKKECAHCSKEFTYIKTAGKNKTSCPYCGEINFI